MALKAVERAEIAAVRSVFEAGAAAGIDAVVEDVHGVLCSACRLVPWDAAVNRALGLGLVRPAGEREIEAVLDFYRRHGTVCAIALSPRAQPPDLGRRLEAYGFAAADPYAMFAAPARPVASSNAGLRVQRLPPEAAADFADVVLDAYELPETLRAWVEAVARHPGWISYATYSGADLAGVGSIYTAGDVCWLAYGGTRARYRGQGSHRLVFDARIDAAYRRGIETVAAATVLPPGGAPTPAFRNAIRSGLELEYKGTDYVVDVVGT